MHTLSPKKFFSKEVLSGLLLIVCAVLALITNNSPLAPLYRQFLEINFGFTYQGMGIYKPLLLWINDGLMAVFFFLVGLEIKREVVIGELKEFEKAILPVAGAVGGMLVPALIFYWFARGHQEIMHGWAIPMATDIAFALGVLAIFGSRVPLSLKLFLMTLAILDDLGAIMVIGIFYTSKLSLIAAMLALLCLAVLVTFNLRKIGAVWLYVLVGIIMWVCVLKSGFHATIAGIMLAMTIPLYGKDGKNILSKLEADIHHVVAYFILPLFAFANAGVPLDGLAINNLLHPLVLGIVCGLFFGKIIGVYAFTIFAKYRFKLKATFGNLELLGVASLCGIGFTMSLFIAGISFSNDETLLNLSRIGILSGSVLSMLLGGVALHLCLPKKEA